MSMESQTYMIAGFDITNNIVNGEKFSDWMFDTDEGSHLINYHRQGEIQIIDDPTYGRCTYLGYIFGVGDMYGDDINVGVTLEDIKSKRESVLRKLSELQDIGLIKDIDNLQYKVFCCTVWS